MLLRQVNPIAACATSDLLLQHLDETLASYGQKQLKHMQYTYETLAKHLKTLESHCKHMQHPDKHLQHICEIICNVQIKYLQHTSGK
jgi:hypothetical protein